MANTLDPAGEKVSGKNEKPTGDETISSRYIRVSSNVVTLRESFYEQRALHISRTNKKDAIVQTALEPVQFLHFVGEFNVNVTKRKAEANLGRTGTHVRTYFPISQP